MSESESVATTALGNAIPNCCFYDHWYNVSETVSPGFPHTIAVYDRGVGAWSPSTVYALNAISCCRCCNSLPRYRRRRQEGRPAVRSQHGARAEELLRTDR